MPQLKHWPRPGNELAQPGDGRFPYVITTYRLTEHYLAGAMSRWNPWLTELQPELFIEMSPELAQEKRIKNLDWVRISTPRGQIRAKALVTRRLYPLTIDGKLVGCLYADCLSAWKAAEATGPFLETVASLTSRAIASRRRPEEKPAAATAPAGNEARSRRLSRCGRRPVGER